MFGELSQSWLERSRAHVWHPCTQMKRHETLPLVPIARARGVWLYDFDGRRYLDAISSWWVNLFGHLEPRIVAALSDQLQNLEHVLLAGFTHAPVVQLSERLCALSGLDHVAYASDGASSVEIALKMSAHSWKNRGLPQKNRFLYLENSYHGETLGALSVTDVPLFREAYGDLCAAHVAVESPAPRAGETLKDAAARAIGALEQVLARDADQIAALICEPMMQGAAGMQMYDADYLRAARALCDRFGVHWIADEVAVGFGRTGRFFAHEHAGVKPDFLCLSKGITGGFLPLSAVLTTAEIYADFYDDDVRRGFLHSHSYTGNALAARAALAVLDIFESDDVLAKNAEKTKAWESLLAPLKAHDRVQNFRHLGFIWAFEVADVGANFAQDFFAAMLARACLLRPIGNTVYFLPPLSLETAEMAHLVAATISALDALPKAQADAALLLP